VILLRARYKYNNDYGYVCLYSFPVISERSLTTCVSGNAISNSSFWM